MDPEDNAPNKQKETSGRDHENYRLQNIKAGQPVAIISVVPTLVGKSEGRHDNKRLPASRDKTPV